MPAPEGTDREDARVYSGSLVVRGFGVAGITATGLRSEIGRIGHALTALPAETTPLLREVRRIVRWVAIAALIVCASIAVIYALSRSDWLGGVLAGITLAMGILPEEFPVVLTVFLAMGAWRISRAGVLTCRMPAVETIGAATVLAVDKTGTLTENRMRVALVDIAGRETDLRRAGAPLDDPAIAVLVSALAASERDAFDPMERAIHEAAQMFAPSQVARLGELELINEYDLTPDLLAVTHVWARAGSVLFLEFVIDPACAFVFEADPEAPETMKRKPRRPDEPLFSRPMLIRSVTLGALVLLVSCVIYGLALRLAPEQEARTLAFIAIIAANLALIFVSRSRSESLGGILAKANPIYWWIAAGTSVALAATIYVPAIAEVFRFAPPDLPAAAAVIATQVSLVLTAGLVLRRR